MNGTNTNTDIPDEFSGVQQSNGVDIKEDNNKVVDNDDVVLKKLPMEAEELKKEGVLLWAKIRGYSYWPGIVTVDPMDAVSIQFNEKTETTPTNKRGAPRSRFKIHVHFLGYDNMRAWITDDNIISYEGKSAYLNMANNCQKAKLKDYFPTKKYQRLFEKAITTAEEIEKLTLKDRLKTLGLVYVPIPDEANTNGKTAGSTTISNGGDKVSFKKGAKRKSTSNVVGDSKESKKIKLSHDNNDKNNASVVNHSVIPKIPSGGGFFKSFRSPGPPAPIAQPPKQETTSLDVFDFDDFDDNALTINLDFPKVKDDKKPSSPLPCLKTTKSEKTTTIASPKPAVTKPSTVQNSIRKKTVQKKALSATAAAGEKPQSGKRKLEEPSPSKQTKATNLTKKNKSTNLTKKAKTKSESNLKKKSKITKKVVRVENNGDAKEVLMKDLTTISTSDFPGDEEEEDDQGKVLLGSLVWGRMSGFPFWPCFITKSPTGVHQRVFGKRKQFHAQFFNWNNESGWVSSTLPWCSIEEYHKQAKIACPKGPNTVEGRTWYPPARLVARWKGAVFEAQKTSKLSRRTRYANLVTHYTSEDVTDTDEAIGDDNTTSKPRIMKKNKAGVMAPYSNSKSNTKQPYSSRKKNSPAKIQKTTTSTNLKYNKPGPASLTGRPRFEADLDSEAIKNNTNKRSQEKPCPASKKKNGVFINGLPIAKLELPTGWCYELSDDHDDKVSLQSPEGITYEGVSEAIKMLMQNNVGPSTRKRSYSCSSIVQDNVQNFGWFLRCTDTMHFDTTPYSTEQAGLLEGPVAYLKDDSLPAKWSVKTIRSQSLDESIVNVVYQSSGSVTTSTSAEKKITKFTNKVNVAQFLEGMGHPALEIEQLLHNFPSICKILPKDNTYNDDDEENISEVYYTINLATTSLDEVAKIPILSKCVVPSCYVDMVKLPEVFLEHPSVIVHESKNEDGDLEETIRDSITNEFIARKIIYD